ncbi:MAG: hypothetical protein JST11_01685 [Acidobacteria bacterium]|nr:hypothetical protein [Acidobacteriota bacterium]
MKRSSVALLALAAILSAAALVRLSQQELAGGSAYPAYSSLRADPDGGKLLFDALSRLPGIAVERNFLPLDGLEQRGAAILLLGTDPAGLNSSEGVIRAIESLAKAGNRVVIAFRYREQDGELRLPRLAQAWDVQVGTDKRADPFFFRESKGWTALESVRGKILVMERAFGAGAILLAAESDPFANDSVLAGRETASVSHAIGDYRRVVFDESHLGIEESGSVVGLARRFHLMGFAAGLALCALLFLWKNLPAFPPPAPARAAARSGMTAQAGLTTLLRRHIPPGDLAATCWHAWLETNRNTVTPGHAARAAEILRQPAAPAETLSRLAALLRSKGEL